ncbi:Hypothetical protein, putative [Bodo saltans]|uniref:Uncharacterized protein n=1 Tax=Bodo saltans TaxID=75058 RepID=A0A0S4IS71_BODSA|nr:Hypothetical protein, putative [Bodo saltans]|eukprot:CUF20285.1 Hypothetical protein, putative [Bodo saltans]
MPYYFNVAFPFTVEEEFNKMVGRIIIITAAVLVAILAASARAACVVAGYDLSQVPVTPLQINQQYNGGNTMYTWIIDLCAAVSVPPASQLPYYFNVAFPFTVEEEFNKMVGRIIIITAAVLVAILAASARAACVVAGYDLSQVPVTPLQINQQYNGGNTMYTWIIDLCAAVSVPPASQPPCAVPGYISEYSSSHCETAWNAMTGSTAGTQSLTANFGQAGSANHLKWTATVTVNCGSTLAFTPIGNAVVTGASTDALNFAFTLTSSAVCGSGPVPTPPPGTPAPAVTPAPPATPIPVGPTPPPATPVPSTPTPQTPPTPPAPLSSEPACSGGCAYVIVVFVGGFVYVVITVLFYYFRQGKRGLELLPHPGFWKEFAYCVKDGVIFSVQKLRALICKSGPYAGDGSSYQQV